MDRGADEETRDDLDGCSLDFFRWRIRDEEREALLIPEHLTDWAMNEEERERALRQRTR